MDDRQQTLLTGPDDGETLVGILDHITFQNAENGFLVGRFIREDARQPITIKGSLFNVREGQTLKLWGAWEHHPDYGRQFAVGSFLAVEPQTIEGMQRFLISAVDGIGKTTARRIVEAFGLETFAVLDEAPDRLREVPKVTRNVIRNLKATWAEHKAVREIMVFLHGLGIGQGYAERIYRQYGQASVEVLKDNPYRLALDVRGIGFRIADSIAMKLDVPRESVLRAEAGLIYTLEELSGEGHTGYPEPRLIERAQRLLEVDRPVVEEALANLVTEGLVRTHRSGEREPPFYLRPRYDKAESRIAEYLERIVAGPPRLDVPMVKEGIESLERETGIYLDPEQRRAVEATLEHKLLILTGGPGTGKTTIIRFILGLVAEGETTIALAAPTGKAAKRMAEATGRPASTIHRLLEATGEGFGRTEERPIDAELVIVDESSMIDTLLMDALLEAIPPQARLALVGDVDQLPSVGAGMVLHDLIESGRFPVVRLERIHRQSQNSLITHNAHRIRKGEAPDLSRPEGEELVDFYFMPEKEPERIVARILELVAERIPERFGFDPRSDIQVLTPMHKGLTGAHNLNRALQETLNPGGAEISLGERRFRVGDRVMQTRNDYEKDVFNGDMGEISAWDPENQTLIVTFDERPVKYVRKGLDSLALAYAITVHKSQGSEYPAVVLPFTTHHAIMLQRNLLYTALTRGKRLVVTIGTERAVAMAVGNARRDTRFTRLKERIVASVPAAPGAPGAPKADPGDAVTDDSGAHDSGTDVSGAR